MQNLKQNTHKDKFSVYHFLKHIYQKCYAILTTVLTRIIFYLNHVKHGTFRSVGLPFMEINNNSQCIFGDKFAMVNNARFATLGKSNRCKIVVYSGAKLEIGNSVGMSNTTIVSSQSIIIGNNILIGGGVTIVDTDFHSLNPVHWHTEYDEKNMKSSPVVINNNVFIGMDSIILKGVTIGSNVIIAAGSVVSKSIPDNQIWAGNPARFVRDNNIK